MLNGKLLSSLQSPGKTLFLAKSLNLNVEPHCFCLLLFSVILHDSRLSCFQLKYISHINNQSHANVHNRCISISFLPEFDVRKNFIFSSLKLAEIWMNRDIPM